VDAEDRREKATLTTLPHGAYLDVVMLFGEEPNT
jgi:hypothetical protein